MKKVNVSIGLLQGSLQGGAAVETVSFTFVYGIGRDGLSDFESCLQDAGCGDRLLFKVKAGNLVASFSCLSAKVRPLVEGKIMPEMLTFDVEILGLEDVANREIVAALARSASGCDSGDSCGDGCC
ncbi:MAG: hypothetical protein COA36_01975 [Desulfotalea sp.]|nr:MAG: hypothetical protein COA36_01975 [Desulfotalea sp.]